MYAATAATGVSPLTPLTQFAPFAPFNQAFVPPRWLQGAHRQTMLASLPPRRWQLERAARGWIAQARTEVLQLPKQVRLLVEWDSGLPTALGPNPPDSPSTTAHAAPTESATRPLAVLLHGWEGSSRSVHMLSLTTVLNRGGIDTLRINFRDHGASHHLNPELFHSCRLDEIVAAIALVRERYPQRPLVLVGFSLGGNFALRVACTPGLDLAAVIAICPPMDPAHSLHRLQHGALVYRHYFLKKWNRSLALKKTHWPQLYDGHNLPAGDDLLAMTDTLVRRYTDYPSVASYFAGYALLHTRLDALTAPAALVLAADDPIIPVSDRALLSNTPKLQVFVQNFGGHCGFLADLNGLAWIDQRVLACIQAL
jgi:uncharacterized protein